MTATRSASPQIRARATPVGLRESYRYEPGPAGRGTIHVHAEVQLCLSCDAPGRYRSGRWAVEVPAGAVSVIDAWEPHATEDPAPPRGPSHYELIYVPTAHWDALAAGAEQSPRVGLVVMTRASAVRAMRSLLRHLTDQDPQLAAEAAMLTLLRATAASTPRAARDGVGMQARKGGLDRARDLIHARFRTGIRLAELAAEAGVRPTYIVDAFHTRFGLPPHRMQTHLRLDLARRHLAAGATIADAATGAGFADQSHLTRQFRRYLGTTPGRYAVVDAPSQERSERLVVEPRSRRGVDR